MSPSHRGQRKLRINLGKKNSPEISNNILNYRNLTLIFLMRKSVGKKLLLISNHSNEILGTVYPFGFKYPSSICEISKHFYSSH